jgi:hypothetical protein
MLFFSRPSLHPLSPFCPGTPTSRDHSTSLTRLYATRFQASIFLFVAISDHTDSRSHGRRRLEAMAPLKRVRTSLDPAESESDDSADARSSTDSVTALTCNRTERILTCVTEQASTYVRESIAFGKW